MYIAFRWLFGLTLAMWLVMCSIDVLITVKENNQGLNVRAVQKVYKNFSVRINKEPKIDLKINVHKEKKSWFGLYHYYAILCAAAFIISAANKRKKIMLFASLRKNYFESGLVRTYVNTDYFKRTASEMYSGISKYVHQIRSDVEKILKKLHGFKYRNLRPTGDHDLTKEVLIKKLKELREEKRNLSLLLAAAICENRNIVVGYRLESMAKNKLVVQTKESERKRKECQSQFMNFQHLYTVTYQENLYLHSRIKHLTKLKEVAEKNLLNLVHEICLSKNEKLMAYCSQFVVQSKEKILSSDMRAEIEKFLKSSNLHINVQSCRKPVGTNTDSTCNSLELKKNLSLSSSPPRLVGLPGEHIWTVKDGDGFIEKFYKCDFETDGNTIRRIREYSVYHDKDCFFENFSSRTIIHDEGYGVGGDEYDLKAELGCNRIQNQRFLTGSQAFQMFLQNTQNFIIPVSTFYRPSISYA